MEAMQYELARNMTLLFFFERLMDKGEPRTLHDLSCQFGSKGFTKEMRQIAGGSQSGLKKFLSQYPSLFAIDGDYVNIRMFQNGKDNANDNEGYTSQAVEYFSEKLAQYGEGTEVPIRSLLGHRSQASPEVRHVSGQHFHEFRDFLQKHPETFYIDDEKEIVVLKNYNSVKSHSQELNYNLIVSINPENTQKLLDFLAKCIDVKGPILVEQLFQLISCNLDEYLWTGLFNTSSQLMSFLRLFSDSFHIQSNLVTLLQHPKLNQKHLNEPKINNYVNETQHNPNHQNNTRNEKIERVTSPIGSKSINDRLKQQRAIQKQPENKINQTETKVNQSEIKLNQSESKLNSSDEKKHQDVPMERPKPISTQNQSLKQRINTLVLKTLQENTGRDRQNMISQSQNYTESWKVSLFQHTRVICTIKECQMVIDPLINSNKKARLNGNFDSGLVWPFTEDKVVVAVDCEGINLGLKGQLTLIQIATMTGFVYVFDLVSCPGMIDYGLKSLLEHPDVIKIIHDCRNDSVNLFRQYDITLRSVFDTQAAHAVLTYQETGRPVYKAKSVALNALCECYGVPTNPIKEQLKNIYRRDQKYWSRRPLTREMILYAAADVLCLIHEKLYYPLTRSIYPENRNLMLELCQEQVLMHISPDSVKLKKRQRKTETEVGELKLKLAQPAKSIVLSNREVRLLRYVELTDEEKEKLKSSAKVAKKLEKLESLGQEKDMFSSEDDDNDYPSIESDVTSPRTSGPTSLTESMQMVDTILNDNNLGKIDKLDKLEAILSSTTALQGNNSENGFNNSNNCNCKDSFNKCLNEGKILSVNNTYIAVNKSDDYPRREGYVDVETQTLSTGDVVITKIYFNEAAE
nr:uncharacterized protein LOC111414625 [Onthophagus taurus]